MFTEQIIKKARLVHSTKYDYSNLVLSEYSTDYLKRSNIRRGEICGRP